MPFDTIKIDKSFVDGIIPDFKTREIVRFLIALCKTSGMEVIAEGVDQAEQVNILKKIKCDTIQGFFYSKPLPIKEYEEFLTENPFEKSEGGANK
jgi:EAL domain-containing protein (putative c-di-GMP-specific phosphodiesterase class I)